MTLDAIFHPVRRAGVVLTLALVLFLSTASEAAARRGGIVCDRPAIDFGVLIQGERNVLKHTFRLTNTSRRDVSILSLRTCCSCEASKPSRHLLRPKECAEVTLTLNVKASMHEVAGLCWVHTDAPASSIVMLTMKANIIPRVQAFPAAISFGLRGEGQMLSAACRVELRWKDKEASVAIGEVTSTSPQVRARKRPTDAVHDRFKGFVRAIPYVDVELNTGMRRGVHQEYVVVCDRAGNKLCRIPVSWRLPRQLDAHPPRAFFGTVPVRTAPSKTIRVRCKNGEPFAIASLDFDERLVDVKIELDSQEGQGCLLRIMLLSNQSKPGIVRDEIKIITNLPGAESILVPVFALRQARP